ncbi:hypothetical protein L9G74_18900 [Shewanella sp. C32]|uniref:Rad50/SbcC-type AAA domain-containing protein n=1 Tax=Shewanella electrica TaxID=515560 RepID=A0ABT2FQ90_9GAMM|nr:hypothetical protein [Shewanella electrica]MCH1926902.1 hypothetical protein [Shewanella electrica]MCS4558508.1 hypothetical protein [Shewanella electrica]
MKLISLKINGKGLNGLESDTLLFSEHITQLFGPNGSGKTPLIQSIAFCLGYPCVFREEIYARCLNAELTIQCGKDQYRFKRKFIENDLDLEVLTNGINKQHFFDEKSFSLFIFEVLNLKVSDLITIGNKATMPYMSTLLPIFYLDQDDGYHDIYHARSFIKDQYSEMLRMLFRLPPKHSFDEKRGKILAKEKLDFHDNKVQIAKREYNLMKEDISSIPLSYVEIDRQIESLDVELENLKRFGMSNNSKLNVYDKIISKHLFSIKNIENEMNQIERRNDGVSKIVSEIESEIETLNLNEESRRVFLSFEEICSSPDCKLFSKSSESYSKNLLYLRDQIKDLQRNSQSDQVLHEQLSIQKDNLLDLVEQLELEKEESTEKSEAAKIVEASSKIKNELFGLQQMKSEIDRFNDYESKLVKIISERDNAFEYHKSFNKRGNTPTEIYKLRSKFSDLFVDWLDSLETINVSRNINFSSEFIPILGQESVTKLKGSTRARVVLAYHAALFELMISSGFRYLEFLILDTPQQHQMHVVDLDKYLDKLKKLAEKYGIQIIFSTTEYRYYGDAVDIDWIPKFDGEKQKMFMRVKNSEIL